MSSESSPPLDPIFTYQQGETVPKDVSNVEFDANVTRIEKGAFEGCENLKKIIIPRGITEIEDDAFKNCTNLTKIELPDSLESIGRDAFYNCLSLSNVMFPDSLSNIEDGAFQTCRSLMSIKLPDGLESVKDYTFYKCSHLTDVELPDSVSSIGKRAFSKCLSLTTIDLPNGVKSIEASTFASCAMLTSIDLPNDLTSIGHDAFSSCTNLISIKLHDKVTYIGRNAFFYCLNLRSIDLPSSVTYIGDSAFSSCSNLTSVKLPDSLFLGKEAFSNCYSVASVTLPSYLKSDEEGTVQEGTIQVSTFEGCSKLMSVALPKNLTLLGKFAFKGCSSIENVMLPEKHTSEFKIEHSCFQNCSALLQEVGKHHDSFVAWLENRSQVTPLHSVCSTIYDGPDDLIQKLEQCLKDNPGCAEKKDKFALTPLHVLTLNPDVTKESLKIVIEAYPDALYSKTSNLMLPQHLLLLNPNLRAELFMKGLLTSRQNNEHYGISMVNADYHSVPSYAIYLNCDEEVQYLLYSHHPVDRKSFRESSDWYYPHIEKFEQKFLDKIKRKDEAWGRLDEHAWVRFVDILSNESESNEILSFIKSEECDRKYVEKLAYAKDQDNRVALNVANRELQEAMKEKILFLGRYDIGSTLHQSESCVVKKAIDMKSDLYYSSVFKKFTKNNRTFIDKNQVQQALEYLGLEIGGDNMNDLMNTFDENPDKITILMNTCDDNKNGVMDESEFLNMCKNLFDNGQNRSVALKFMKNKDEFDREIDIRKILSDDCKGRKYFVSIDNHRNFEDENYSLSKFDEELGPYKFLLVMCLADRNLEEIIRSEHPNEGTKEGYLSDLIDCLEYIHSKGIIHGDLKTSNIVRYKGRLRLIDFDASLYICQVKETKESRFYVGKRFSSGVLPPEMIFECKDETDTSKFQKYFAAEASKNDALWNKLKPKQSQVSRRVFVVKSFLTKTQKKKDPMGKKYQVETVIDTGLPDKYVLVQATAAIDMWALGSIVYYMHTGLTLFDVDINDELKDGKAMRDLCDWKVDGSNATLDKITDKTMKRVLVSLLEETPEERGTSADARNIIDNKTTDLDEIAKIVEMNSEKVMTSIYDATSVKVPTSFIIVPYKIHDIQSDVDITQEMLDFGESIISEAGIMTDVVKKFSSKEYYLYLLDEYDYSIIDEPKDPYPIVIEKPSPDLMNAMSTVLTAIKTYNKTAKFAKLLFPFVPEVPDNITNTLEDNFTPEDVPFSVENNDKVTVGRGNELRKFQTFLEEKDPNNYFCDLIRVHNPETGKAMWVTQKSLDKMESGENVQYKKDDENLENRKKIQEKSNEVDEKSEQIEELKNDQASKAIEQSGLKTDYEKMKKFVEGVEDLMSDLGLNQNNGGPMSLSRADSSYSVVTKVVHRIKEWVYD